MQGLPNDMRTEYNTLIIGAGNIGAFYDTPDTDRILTHAHAFTKHEGFNLVGFVDVDQGKAEQAVSLWGGEAFPNMKDAFNEANVDVVCVSTPDDSHFDILKAVTQFPVKLVFAEKPLAKTTSQAAEILQVYRGKGIPIAINYIRRFIPELEKLRSDIGKGLYGSYITGTGYYGKGLLHNGSHMIDLLRYFIGEIKSAIPVGRTYDFYEDDPSVAAVLTFDSGKPFYLQYVDCNLYTIFEIDILFEKRRIRMTNLGFAVEEYEVHESAVFKGYNNMAKTNEVTTSMNNALYHAAKNIYDYLAIGEKLKCSVDDGYKALELCIRIGAS